MGNALPFWAAAGAASFVPIGARRVAAPAALRWLPACLIAPLGFSFLLLQSAQRHDTAQGEVAAHQPVTVAPGWPPDPDILFWTGQPDAATIAEPDTRMFFRLARTRERDGQTGAAIAAFKQAVAADPHSLQGWQALAQTQEKAGDTAGALQSWRELIARYEGPGGQIRALPELPETNPAWAYVALARSAPGKAVASGYYDKAAAVIEAYSYTPPAYQQAEAAIAQAGGADLAGRRGQVRALYETIMNALGAGADPNRAASLAERRGATLARLDAFAAPASEPVTTK